MQSQAAVGIQPRVGLHIMHLVVAATQKEMSAFEVVEGIDRLPLDRLVSGVGPVETAFSLGRYLERNHRKIRCVVNFGIGGAYLRQGQNPAAVLDICLAEQEVLGDFGVCYGADIEPFGDADFPNRSSFELDRELLRAAETALANESISAQIGTFVTVSGASGTRQRGAALSKRYRALCENMEGAAVARACELYGKPMLEVRAISNLVEDRPGSPWKIGEACSRSAGSAAIIIKAMQHR